MSYLASEAWADTSVQITACSARLQGELVCIGNDDGIVELYDITEQKKLEVARSGTGMNVEHIAWDEDGKRLVLLWLGGSLTSSSLEYQPDSKGSFRWRCRADVKFKLNTETGRIHQLLLSPGSDLLLVASSNGGQLWSMRTKSLLTTCVSDTADILQKWVNHPWERDQILAFTPTSIIAYAWDTLEELRRWHLPSPASPSRNNSAERSRVPKKELAENSTSPESDHQFIEQAILTKDGQSILVHISHSEVSGKRQPHILLIDKASLKEKESSENAALEPLTVPHDITSLIERPLGVLGKDKLVFLDRSFWVCTWRLRRVNVQGGAPTGHFFLPRDWVNAESLKLCRIMADGTFLCPRKGEVAVVRSGLGSDW